MISKTPILIISVLITYLVMNCFISVYTVAVDTILLCYCEEKRFGGYQSAITDFAKKSIENLDSVDSVDSTEVLDYSIDSIDYENSVDNTTIKVSESLPLHSHLEQ